MTANTKGKYKYQDKEETFEADFGKPLIEIGEIVSKYEKN